jgi:hypothetical protein
MAKKKTPRVGTIAWQDLTVRDAEKLRDFYCRVVGWNSRPLDMGGYSDFEILPPGGRKSVAGICWARGSNAKLPPQWLIYIQVRDLTESMRLGRKLGGKVLDGPRKMGKLRFCVVRDPAGAVAALVGP